MSFRWFRLFGLFGWGRFIRTLAPVFTEMSECRLDDAGDRDSEDEPHKAEHPAEEDKA